jgi:heme exporter protein A
MAAADGRGAAGTPAAGGASRAGGASPAGGASRARQPAAAGGAAPEGIAATADELALDLRGVGRAYGERVALADVTLTLAAGQTLAVLGANGAGKTTLLRVLATLLRPHAGTARVLGCRLPEEAWRVRGRIGLLAHEPLLYRDLSASENLRFHAQLHDVRPARAAELLDAVGLGRRADEPVRALSRGMAQRVAICRTVLHRPELLLLDEPYANLDPGGTAAVAPLIGPEADVTRVLISHDVEAGLAEADLVLGLRAGRPALLAPASEVRADDLRELYR